MNRSAFYTQPQWSDYLVPHPFFAEMGDAEVTQLFWECVEAGDAQLGELVRVEAARREIVL